MHIRFASCYIIIRLENKKSHLVRFLMFLSLFFHDAIIMFQLFQLTMCSFVFMAFATTASLTNEPKISNNGRIGRVPPRIATGSICFIYFFIFKPMSIFVLTFITAQTALSLRVESRDNTFYYYYYYYSFIYGHP